MEVYFHPSDSWQDINQQLKEALDEDLRPQLENIEVRLYPTVAFAVLDCFQGFRSLFTFKKDFGFIKGQDPYIDHAAKVMAAAGLMPKPFSSKYSELPTKVKETLGRETCFMAYTCSSPLILQPFETQALDESCEAATIAKIRIDYSSRTSLLKSIDKKTAHIVGLSNGHAACLLGERVRFKSHYSSTLDWTRLQSLPNWMWSSESVAGNEAYKFEPEFKVLVENAIGRYVVYSEKVDASAVLETLSKTLSPEEMQGFSTPSLSYWGGLTTMDWLKEAGFDLNQLRGTILVDQQLISDKLIAVVKEAFHSVLELQNGDQRTNEAPGLNN